MISPALLKQLGQTKLEEAASLHEELVGIETEHVTACAWDEAHASRMAAALKRANEAYREYGELSASRVDLAKSRTELERRRDAKRAQVHAFLNDLLPEGERRETHTQEPLFA